MLNKLIFYKNKMQEKKDTKQIGNITELQCITRLYELGYSVSIPYGDSNKYDLILDCHGVLLKLQCKHAIEDYNENNEIIAIRLKTRWQSGYTKNSQYHSNKYTKEDIDYFITFYNNKCYLIPVEECSTEKKLWIKPSKKMNTMSFLEEYIDEEVLNKI